MMTSVLDVPIGNDKFEGGGGSKAAGRARLARGSYSFLYFPK